MDEIFRKVGRSIAGLPPVKDWAVLLLYDRWHMIFSEGQLCRLAMDAADATKACQTPGYTVEIELGQYQTGNSSIDTAILREVCPG